MLDRDRLAKCLALAERGATEGERAAAMAAAERIAASAGLTLAEARRQCPATAAPRVRASSPGRRRPIDPTTVAGALRERAVRDARRRQRARAGKRPDPFDAEHEAWEAEARARQAERDRAWAERAAASAEPSP